MGSKNRRKETKGQTEVEIHVAFLVLPFPATWAIAVPRLFAGAKKPFCARETMCFRGFDFVPPRLLEPDDKDLFLTPSLPSSGDFRKHVQSPF